MSKFNIPFYANTLDNTYCYQAALKMVLKYFWPEKDFGWQELEQISAKPEGKWTWPMAALLWLKKNGFDVKAIEDFDYERFSTEGGEYLRTEFGDEFADSQISHSDIEQEIRFSREFVSAIYIEKKVPSVEDIKQLNSDGFIPIVNLNSAVLNKRKGYAGHSVVITGINDKGLVIHDPGLPPQKNRFVDFELFENAWAYPSKKAKNIYAIKK